MNRIKSIRTYSYNKDSRAALNGYKFDVTKDLGFYNTTERLLESCEEYLGRFLGAESAVVDAGFNPVEPRNPVRGSTRIYRGATQPRMSSLPSPQPHCFHGPTNDPPVGSLPLFGRLIDHLLYLVCCTVILGHRSVPCPELKAGTGKYLSDDNIMSGEVDVLRVERGEDVATNCD